MSLTGTIGDALHGAALHTGFGTPREMPAHDGTPRRRIEKGHRRRTELAVVDDGEMPEAGLASERNDRRGVVNSKGSRPVHAADGQSRAPACSGHGIVILSDRTRP